MGLQVPTLQQIITDLGMDDFKVILLGGDKVFFAYGEPGGGYVSFQQSSGVFS